MNKVSNEYIGNVSKIIHETIPEFQNIKIDLNIFDYKDKDGDKLLPSAVGTYDINFSQGGKKIYKCKFTVINDFMTIEVDDKEYFDRVFRDDKIFLKSIGCCLNNESLTILNLLHEYGHLHYLLNTSRYGSINNIINYNTSCENFIKTIFNFRKLSRDKTKHETVSRLYYDTIPDELYADRFKFLHFIEIYNTVNKNSNIKNIVRRKK